MSPADPDLVQEPVAICGMGMRLPGGVRNAEAFWRLLCSGSSGRCKVPKDRYNAEGFLGGAGKAGPLASEYGYFLDDVDLGNIDTSFWSMTREEMAALDPQQRLALEVVYEALQSAGECISDLRGRNVGVYSGTFEGDWRDVDGKDPQNHHIYRLTGYGDFMPANRISREFDFVGPSITVRTACSSSLTALHEACRALWLGDCEAAVVVGANIICSPSTTLVLAGHGALSPTARCRTFDAEADGYVRGEAVSAVYLKRLRDAVCDGTPVRSVVRSTAVGCTGCGSSTITTPSAAAMETLMRRCGKLAEVDLARAAMVECHGTGTAVGDPIEAQAVANVFGEDGIYIGSVKPHLGHSEGASGLSSVIKMTLALEKKTIPPNINFKTPNPQIPFAERALTVPLRPMPWPPRRDEVVVVNSFGIGGSNAVALLSSLDAPGIERYTSKAAEPLVLDDYGRIEDSDVDELTPRLLLFSAKHPNALKRSIQDHEAYLISHPEPSTLRNLSFSLATKREHMHYRAFCVADSLSDWVPTYAVRPVCMPANSGQRPKLVFVFTGQGAQWAGMGSSLMRSVLRYRETIDRLDEVLEELALGPGWSLADELEATGEDSRLSDAQISQPCSTAVQIALVELLAHWGVHSDAVIGHSSGEIAAAFSAGLITAKEAIIISYHRGLAVTYPEDPAPSCPGGMAAVGLSPEVVSRYLRPGVLVGCENSPSSTTITGDCDAVESVVQLIKEEHPDALARLLHVDRAYHSHHMIGAAKCYRGLLEGVIESKSGCQNTPFFSSITGDVITNATEVGPDYWVRNLMHPVKFSSAIAKAAETIGGNKIFLEIGPHSALAGPIRQTLQNLGATDCSYVSTLVRNLCSHANILTTAGALWLEGLPLLYSNIAEAGHFLRDLPTYPWHYEEPLWRESRLSKAYRMRQFPHHDILGSRVLESTDDNPAWRNVLRPEQSDWVLEYEVGGRYIFPVTGYICMVGEAARQVSAIGRSVEDGFTARNVRILEPLVFCPGEAVEIVTQLWCVTSYEDDSQNPRCYKFSISSLRTGTDVSETWISHARGQVKTGMGNNVVTVQRIDANTERQRLHRLVSREDWYGKLRTQHIRYGVRLACLDNMRCSTDVIKCRAIATTINSIHEDESAYAIHPATLDGLFQAASLSKLRGVCRRLEREPLVTPKFIATMSVRSVPTGSALGIIGESQVGEYQSDCSGTVFAYCDEKLVAIIEGLRFSNVEVASSKIEERMWEAAELIWKEDIDLVDAHDTRLIHVDEDQTDVHRLLDRFASACILDAAEKIRQITPGQGHLVLYAEWLKIYADGIWPPLDEEDRHALFNELRPMLQQSTAAPAAEAIWRTMSSIEAVVSGKVEMLEMLLGDDMLHRLYDFISDHADCSALLALLAHKNPNLSILEIGAGTGGTTAKVLAALNGPAGERMYARYVFTDISSGFFPAARDRLKQHDGIEFKLLDISQDPLKQGFDSESFDLIIACNVLHATPRLQETLQNVRKLLRPQGWLFLQELSPATKWINFVFGAMSGWWLGNEDGRYVEPYIPGHHWDKQLRSTGFAGIESLSYDGYFNYNIISRPDSHTRDASHGYTLVGRYYPIDPTSRIASSVSANQRPGHRKAVPGTQPPANHRVMSGHGLIHGPGTEIEDRIDNVSCNMDESCAILKARGDRAYLLAGLDRRLEYAIATWLVELGARHFVLVNTLPTDNLVDSGKDGQDPLEFELASLNCTVKRMTGDACSSLDMAHALEAEARPFAGVIQLLPALEAHMLSGGSHKPGMTSRCWEAETKFVKRGAETLHGDLQLKQSEPLDFICWITSATGTETHAGDAFIQDGMDALASQWRAFGVATSWLHLNLTGDESQESVISTHLLRHESDFLDILNRLLAPHAQHTHIAIYKPNNLPRNDARFAIWQASIDRRKDRLKAAASAGSVSADEQQAELNQLLDATRNGSTRILESPDTATLLARAIGRGLLGLLMRPHDGDIELDAPLETMGIDSLVGLELRNWLRRVLGVDLNVRELVQAGSCRRVGIMVQHAMIERIKMNM